MQLKQIFSTYKKSERAHYPLRFDSHFLFRAVTQPLLFTAMQCNMKYTCLNPDAGKALILAPTAQGRYVMIHKVNRTTL